MRKLATLVTLAALALSALGCSSSPSSTRSGRDASAPEVPLSTTFDALGASWAVLPMGDLGEAVNTFWQVFVDRSGGRFVLATPPGIADNGGLVHAGGVTGPVRIGVLASQLLGFSAIATASPTPAARRASAAPRWSPAVLPRKLSPFAGALAELSSDRMVALTGRRGDVVLESDGDASSWRRLVTLARLKRSTVGRECGLDELTAAASGADGSPLLAGECRHEGEVALFAERDGSLHSSLVRLSGQSTRDGAQVVSLGASEVVVATGGARQGLVGLRHYGDTWRKVSQLVLGRSEHLFEIGRGASGSLAVLGASGTAARPERETLHVLTGSSWASEPRPPAGTEAVAEVGGALEAFVVEHSTCLVERSTGSAWHLLQRIHVPIQYGSSS